MSIRHYNVERHCAELIEQIEQDIPPSISTALKVGGSTDAQTDITALLLPTNSQATAVILTHERVFYERRWLEAFFSQLGAM